MHALPSKGGADHHPVWYFNIREPDEVKFQIATQAFRNTWREPESAERDKLCAFMVDCHTFYAAYQQATDHVIPLVMMKAAEPIPVFRASDATGQRRYRASALHGIRTKCPARTGACKESPTEMSDDIFDCSDIDQDLGKPLDFSSVPKPATNNDIRRWVHAMHFRTRATGRLWQGRFSSAAMDEHHLHAAFAVRHV